MATRKQLDQVRESLRSSGRYEDDVLNGVFSGLAADDDVPSRGFLGNLGAGFEEGYMNKPLAANAGLAEKAGSLVGENIMPALGVGLSAPLVPLLGPAALPAGAAIGKGLQVGSRPLVDLMQGRGARLGDLNDLNDASVEVGTAGAAQLVGGKIADKAAKGISKAWNSFKGAAKEAGPDIAGAVTRKPASSFKLYAEQAKQVEEMSKKVPHPDLPGYEEYAYVQKYREGITPEGSKTPLKQFWQDLGEKFKRPSLDFSESELNKVVDKVVNYIGKRNKAEESFASSYLQYSQGLSAGMRPGSAHMKGLAKITQELSKGRLKEIPKQDVLNAIQILNHKLQQPMEQQKALALAKTMDDLVAHAELNGLPRIKEAMKAWSLGNAGRHVSAVSPGAKEATEQSLRAAAVSLGYWLGGAPGMAAMAAGQSPRAWKAMINAAKLSGVGIEKIGQGMKSAAPFGGQVLGSMMNKPKFNSSDLAKFGLNPFEEDDNRYLSPVPEDE